MKKKMTKLLSVCLCLVVSMAYTVPVFATEDETSNCNKNSSTTYTTEYVGLEEDVSQDDSTETPSDSQSSNESKTDVKSSEPTIDNSSKVRLMDEDDDYDNDDSCDHDWYISDYYDEDDSKYHTVEYTCSNCGETYTINQAHSWGWVKEYGAFFYQCKKCEFWDWECTVSISKSGKIKKRGKHYITYPCTKHDKLKKVKATKGKSKVKIKKKGNTKTTFKAKKRGKVTFKVYMKSGAVYTFHIKIK